MKNEEIKRILDRFFASISDQAIKEDEDLFQNGILDSQGVLQLVVFLETEFNINIDATDVTFENMETIEAIIRLVQSAQ